MTHAEPIRVLYVEDDERLARLTLEYLTSHGLEVHLIPRGDLAIAAITAVRPDVVLLDLMLPGMDVKRIVDAHGAGIAVTSEVGAGTVARISVPLAR